MGKLVDLTGKRFSRLLVVGRAKNRKAGTYWRCVCDCGSEKEVLATHLVGKQTKSCGCLNRELCKDRATKHGLVKEPLYSVWNDMNGRCSNKNIKQYADYGGRGITVCDEWLGTNGGLQRFVSWAMENGYEKGLEIDRKNNNGNYEPSNCQFITSRENNLNKRMQTNNKSGYVGVNFFESRGTWRSTLVINGKQVLNKTFKTKKQAVEARNSYIVENHLEKEYKIQKYI